MSSSKLPPLELLDDEPIRKQDQDRLELLKWAKVVASAALGTRGPFTIGIFGRWGTGKTSVLHLARGLIDEERSSLRAGGKITTVMFNAWRHESDEIPLAALIASILEELGSAKGAKNRWQNELRSALRAVLHGVSVSFKGGLPTLGEAGVDLDGSKVVEKLETLRRRWIDQQIDKSLYLNAFKALRGLAAQDSRVVVFIDDLDRCLPDRAMHLLESIKLVLSEPGFIFVIAVDRQVLEAYLDKRFHEDYWPEDSSGSSSYLAKFIQLRLWIPAHESRFQGFIERTLEERVPEDCRSDLLRMKQEIGLACDHNPRQLVRFLNDILVDRYLFRLIDGKAESFPMELFVAARGIRLQSSRAYRGLLKRQDLCDLLKSCRDAEQVRKEILPKLEGSADRDSRLLSLIYRNDGLATFLAQQPAKQWLTSEENRVSVEEFLSANREADEAIWSEENMMERALAQIRSEEPGTIVRGCYILSSLRSPLLHEAIPRLEVLAQDANERIAGEARRTLASIRP